LAEALTDLYDVNVEVTELRNKLAAKDTQIKLLAAAATAAKNLYDAAHWIAEGVDSTTADSLWRKLRDTLHAARIYTTSDRASR